jgi:hypothetical protein
MTEHELNLCKMLFNRDGLMTVLADGGGVVSIHRTLDVWSDDSIVRMVEEIRKEWERRGEL